MYMGFENVKTKKKTPVLQKKKKKNYNTIFNYFFGSNI